MIYLDNAATTMRKPQEVIDAITAVMCSMGNAGRGVNEASLGAARTVYDTREKLAGFFGAEDARQIVFTMNSTESLNIAIKGILNPGDHVISTVLEHNSVLRPLYEMEKKGVCVNWNEMRTIAQKALERLGVDIDVNVQLGTLSTAKQQLVAIARALACDAKLIIMDEPTSSISNKEVDMLFEKIRKLREQGISFLYISHKMEEIFQIADDITIIRDGKSIISGPVKDFTEDSIITHMVGRSIDNIYPKEEVPIGDVVFEAKNLCSKDMFKNVCLNVRKGEIVGMAGLVGAGRSEVCRAIFGLDPLDSGEITLAGKPYKPKDVTHAIKNKILMITEDRKKEGIIGVRSCRENITLTSHHIEKGGFINLKKEVQDAQRMSEMLKVRFAGIETPIGSLSGGNQQKVLLCRWLMLESNLLILDEPTRGIDVGAKLEIYNIITDLAKKGYAILMISSEMPELLGMCDRIYVMSQGYVTGCLNRNEFEQERIMQLATGHVK